MRPVRGLGTPLTNSRSAQLTQTAGTRSRVRADGKFFYAGEDKLWLRGVTYGTFAPVANATGYPEPKQVADDFASMRENGINVVRTYTSPPRWLLDLALAHGLRVFVGLAWESHVAFLDKRGVARAIERRVREGIAACAGHPAVVAYAVGNEIPAPIVRWHGKRRIERFLRRLYRAAKEADPNSLVTYVNFPSTEYLDLPFLDFVCFNVYLENEEDLAAYLARLQNLAGDRPLVMGEIGLDSRRNGENVQAITLSWQLRMSYAAGCAGAFVFAWTDEWHRGGHDVEDWDFGLVDRERRPKASLRAVRDAFAEVPFAPSVTWPRISVVVCTYNGEKTIGTCLDNLACVDYPDYEVIVVDDGSTDATTAIAERYDTRLIRTDNRGLAAARNTGLAAATGEIVAYIDDDAWPDRDWLAYLATAFATTPHAAIGGPNIAPPTDDAVATSVAAAPGGPVHVLLSDDEAEHIPGCNSAFRKECLEAIGGWDPQFRIAGDDVDVCWRLEEHGGTIGFCHGAVVWHRRRSSILSYFRQQRDYGKAEALLERKWPDRYNRGGHLSWSGRVYAGPFPRTLGPRWRVYYGPWGSAAFQSVYERAPATLTSLPLMPEWYLLIAALAGATMYEAALGPVFMTVPLLQVPLSVALLALALAPLVAHAAVEACRMFPAERTPVSRLHLRALTAFLYALQPLARLFGRMRQGLTPWRTRPRGRTALPLPRETELWSETWTALPGRVETLGTRLRAAGNTVRSGGEFDRWDLAVRAGSFGGVRLRATVEEHGFGRQLVRVRTWPRLSLLVLVPAFALAGLAICAVRFGAVLPAVALSAVAVFLMAKAVREAALASASVADAVVEPASARDPNEPRPDVVETLESRLRERAVAGAAAVEEETGP